MSDARKRAEEALNRTGQRCRSYISPGCVGNMCESCDYDYSELRDALRAFLAEPAPACGSVSTVRSDDPPAAPLPTCANCGSNFITTPAPHDATEHPCGCYAPDGDHCHRHPAPPAADEVREAAERLRGDIRRDAVHPRYHRPPWREPGCVECSAVALLAALDAWRRG